MYPLTFIKHHINNDPFIYYCHLNDKPKDIENNFIKYISNDNFLGANLFKNNYAAYESKVELDNESPSLGYGYSYASRRNVEKFNGTDEDPSDNNSDIIVFMLFFILLLLFVYNIYYKKKNKS